MLRYLLVLLPLFVLLSCGKTNNQQGRVLYDTHCANCHMENGDGLARLIPPLAGSDFLRDNPGAVVHGIRHGMEGAIVVNGVTYDEAMPGNVELSEFQIVNIMNYINQAWGNDFPEVTVAEARKWLVE